MEGEIHHGRAYEHARRDDGGGRGVLPRGDDAAEAEFVPVEEGTMESAPWPAFDHRLSIKNALEYIASEGRE